MFRTITMLSAAAIMAAATAHAAPPVGPQQDRTLVVTMTNDPSANQIRVYDAATHALLQTLSTHGKGGAAGNARGVRQLDGELVAAVNNGSGTVAIFRNTGAGLRFDTLVTTTSAPVSVDFGNGHMYVAGATTVDSFVVRHDEVQWNDGSTGLQLAGGGAPPAGSTAQVGVVDDGHLLVTLKADPDPGTVDVVSLEDGAVSSESPKAVPGPAASLTPFGFSVYRDGTAVITLAHTSENGLFRDGAFTAVITPGQAAPCWTTRVGKYVFSANTGSKTLTRLVGTGGHIFVDAPVAASILTGGAPSDIDAADGVLGVVDHDASTSHVSLFTYNAFGELTAGGSPIALGVPNANGIAIVPGRERGDR